MTQPKFGQIWVRYLGWCLKKEVKMMKNKFFSTWPETHNRISPRTGLGLGVEVSIPKYPTQYLPQNRSTWFMTYDLDEKKFPMYLA